VEALAWDQLLAETVGMGVDENTSWTDDYNERNYPFTDQIESVTVERKGMLHRAWRRSLTTLA
jgi:hypothetical protein